MSVRTLQLPVPKTFTVQDTRKATGGSAMILCRLSTISERPHARSAKRKTTCVRERQRLCYAKQKLSRESGMLLRTPSRRCKHALTDEKITLE
jgi:hypothetical protein